MPRLVGDQQPGRARVAACPQHGEHPFTSERVKGAGRLVGEDQPTLTDQRPGDRDPLLLATGHLVGIAVGQLVQPQLVQGADGGPPGLADPAAVELEREADVLGRGERRDEVEVLEDHADPAATQRGEVGRAQRRGRLAVDLDAASGRQVEGAREVEQGRLAAAAGAHDRDELTGLDGEAHAVEGAHRGGSGAVDAVDVGHAQDEIAHGVPPVGTV